MTPGFEQTNHARWPLLIGLLGLPVLGLVSAFALGRSAQDEALAALSRLDLGLAGGLLAVSASIMTIRSLRYWLLARAAGIAVPLRTVALYYVGGYGLQATPGKLGAAGLRIWLLRTGAGARTHRAAAAWYAESLLDLVSLAGLGCLGAAILWPGPGLAATLGFLLALFLGFRGLGRLHELLRVAYRLTGVWRTGFAWGSKSLRHLAALPASALSAALGLALLCRAAEISALCWVVNGLGAELGLGAAAALHAVGTLAGYVSMMPGGMGGAEAALVGLQMALGITPALALAATLLFRIAVFWSLVGIGSAVLPVALFHARRAMGRARQAPVARAA
jgi:uncharacterized membrane protein YbhN (UPF0104 family)